MPPAPDVIVIGAGLGGLTAAARLVQEGLRVLVLDRNTHPAGTAAVFQRKGFHFPMGPLGFSTPETVRRTLRELGDEQPLDLLRVDYRLRAFGLDLPLSRPGPELEEEFIRQFPDERAGIRRFFQALEELVRPFKETPGAENCRSSTAAAATLARHFLSGSIKDDRLMRILGSQGTREPYASLLSLAAQWNLMLNEGIWYPADGWRTLGDRLSRLVRRAPGKGEIRLGAEVARILVRAGQIGGVELASGEGLEAPVVVSNADFKNTFLRLLERRTLPAGLYGQVVRARQTESNLQVSLGLKKDRLDLAAFARAGHLIFRREQEQPPPRWELPEIQPEELAAGELELCLWTREDPGLAPAGREVLIIRTAADYGHFARMRPEWKKRSPGYLPYKQRLGWALVREAETILPGLTGAVEVLDVATPLTFEERGGRSEGAVAGWSWDFTSSRERSSRDLVRTPIAGLFMAGYQAFSTLFSGGVPTALESGKRAAEYILRGAGPAEDFRLPGEKGE